MSNERCNLFVEFILIGIECIRGFGDRGQRRGMGEDGIEMVDRIVIG